MRIPGLLQLGFGVLAGFFGAATPLCAERELDEFAGTNLLQGAVLLQTGSGSTLTRSNLSWSASTNLSHPALVFAFGFASDETFAPAEFLDSFSVTLRDEARSFVAPVLTADVWGSTVAPANPDGAQFDERDLQLELLPLPPLFAAFRSQQAFLVLVVLPPTLIGQRGTLGLSLFDNLNTNRSLGFISHISVVPGPGTFMVVESSASVEGPYAPEPGILVRHARRCLTLPRPGAHRFYRLRSRAQSQFIRMRPEQESWAFDYTGGVVGTPPVLESSAQIAGPYAVENGVTAPTAFRLRVRQDGFSRFFRIRSDIPFTIRSLNLQSQQVSIRYEEPHP